MKCFAFCVMVIINFINVHYFMNNGNSVKLFVNNMMMEVRSKICMQGCLLDDRV